MRIAYLTAIAALSIGLAGPVLAAQTTTPAKSGTDTSTQNMNENGLNSLGVDISQAGSTPESVKAFIAAQTPDAQKGITSGCTSIMADQSNVPPAVVSFCKNAQ